MKKAFLSALVLGTLAASTSAFAQIQIGPTAPPAPSAPSPLIVAFGEDTTVPASVASIPGYSANNFTGDVDMLSRVVGGETITITFSQPQDVHNIALYAASQLGGNVLIHSVTAELASDGSSVALTPLYTLGAGAAGNPTSGSGGALELVSGAYVSSTVSLTGGQLFNSITVQAEGDLENDNTLYVVVNSDQSLTPGMYTVSRPNPGVDQTPVPTPPQGPFPGRGWGHGWGHQPPPPVFDCRRFPMNPRCHHQGPGGPVGGPGGNPGWGGPGGHPHP